MSMLILLCIDLELIHVKYVFSYFQVLNSSQNLPIYWNVGTAFKNTLSKYTKSVWPFKTRLEALSGEKVIYNRIIAVSNVTCMIGTGHFKSHFCKILYSKHPIFEPNLPWSWVTQPILYSYYHLTGACAARCLSFEFGNPSQVVFHIFALSDQ